LKALHHLFYCVCCLVGAASAETLLLPSGEETIWSYLDGKADPGEGWTQPEFNDSEWKKGHAPLGYAKPGLKTEVLFGDDPTNKPLTAYFRATFEGPPKEEKAFAELGLIVSYDDGVAVYVNGKEVTRINLHGGTLTPETTATVQHHESHELVTTIPVDLLRYGAVNTVAVEVHQASPTSSDLYLDLKLSGLQTGESSRLHPYKKAKEESVRARAQDDRSEGTPILLIASFLVLFLSIGLFILSLILLVRFSRHWAHITMLLGSLLFMLPCGFWFRAVFEFRLVLNEQGSGWPFILIPLFFLCLVPALIGAVMYSIGGYWVLIGRSGITATSRNPQGNLQ